MIIVAAHAEQVRITVLDGELDLPLEGAKIFLNENRSLTAETDFEGTAVLELDDGFEQGNIVCQFPGYAQSIQHIESGENEIKILMTISNFLEGKELIVARAAQKSSQQSGVSVVMTKEQMDTTARSGLVEDVMSSVGTMPGMTFGGQWNSEPSVRGGYPREMAYAFDGVYIMFPWHWGGAYSIFNPNFVESTKLNNGVFSAEYGRAVSGLLEVNSVMPDDQVHFTFDLNYISSSLFLSAPISKKAGVVFGAKVTYLETLIGTYRHVFKGSQTDMIEKPPYIRDFYTKAFYEPTDKITFTFNGFFGSDGIGLDMNEDNVESKDEVISTGLMKYDLYQAFTGFDAKWMVNDDVQVNGRFAWSMMKEDLSMNTKESGFIKYNQDFVEKYSAVYPGKVASGGGYNLNTSNSYTEKVNNHQLQGKLDTEIRMDEFNRFKFGAEEVLAFGSVEMDADMWLEHDFGGPSPLYRPVKFSSKSENNKTWNTSSFAIWKYGNDDSLLKGEVGVRLDHMKITGKGVDINSPVDINPRVTVHYVPVRVCGKIEKVVFTTGAGLFSAVPFDASMVSERILVEDKTRMDRAVFSVLGAELDLEDGWKFSLEGYYKQYLNRLYVVNDERNPVDVITRSYTDGKGYTAGFDLMAQKSVGEKWNGYLTYSYIYARYMNPTKAEYKYQETTRGDPLDEWYYPQFHRFNTMNLIVNYKPVPSWTFTLKGTLATGTPRTDGDKYCYAAIAPDGTVMQRYTRSHFYSDTLRTDISCPVDIRIAHTGTFKNHPKWKWEWYLGAEDIFLNLYSPKGSDRFNQTTGKPESSDVNFSIGIPMISLGYRLSI